MKTLGVLAFLNLSLYFSFFYFLFFTSLSFLFFIYKLCKSKFLYRQSKCDFLKLFLG